jgi:hypothetical protein
VLAVAVLAQVAALPLEVQPVVVWVLVELVVVLAAMAVVRAMAAAVMEVAVVALKDIKRSYN